MTSEAKHPAPTIGELGRVWAGIGLQSFGGGASTQLLIRRAFVEQRGWIGAAELGHLWNLCQFTPGINILALTILIGRKLGGMAGLIISLLGLLLPSAAITCALAAAFVMVQGSVVVQATLRGVVPATAGIMAVVAFNYARPLFQAARQEGARSIALTTLLIAASAAALIVMKLSVIAVLAGTALLSAVLFRPWRTPARRTGAKPLGEDQPA